jgi:hypothetical protein
MKIWAKTKEFFEGKFLVVRRDGTIPAWPHFVLGAREPAAPAAIAAYAMEAKRLGLDPAFVTSLYELASDFEKYRLEHGEGDPDAAPHRKDADDVIAAMRGADVCIYVKHEPNHPKSKMAVVSSVERIRCMDEDDRRCDCGKRVTYRSCDGGDRVTCVHCGTVYNTATQMIDDVNSVRMLDLKSFFDLQALK